MVMRRTKFGISSKNNNLSTCRNLLEWYLDLVYIPVIFTTIAHLDSLHNSIMGAAHHYGNHCKIKNNAWVMRQTMI